MKQNRYMRLIIFFDLPQNTAQEKKKYLKFRNFLKENGYIRIQYSIYCKLCINIHTLNTQKKYVEVNSPVQGDIRFLAISESQYQSIKNVNNTYSLQEKVTTADRILIIGEINENRI